MSWVRFQCSVCVCMLVGCIGLNRVEAEIISKHTIYPVVVEPLPLLLNYSFVGDPVVLKGGSRIPLAVPSLGSAARVSERFEDLLPVVEQPFQADRVWGYWLGYSPWHAYSFDFTSNRLYWDWYWARFSDQDTTSVSIVPEPGTFLLMLLGFILMLWRRNSGTYEKYTIYIPANVAISSTDRTLS